MEHKNYEKKLFNFIEKGIKIVSPWQTFLTKRISFTFEKLMGYSL